MLGVNTDKDIDAHWLLTRTVPCLFNDATAYANVWRSAWSVDMVTRGSSRNWVVRVFHFCAADRAYFKLKMGLASSTPVDVDASSLMSVSENLIDCCNSFHTFTGCFT